MPERPTPPTGALRPGTAALRPRPAGAAGLAELETLEGLFAAWVQVREEHRTFLATCQADVRRLEEQGALLLGAAEVARKLTGAGGDPSAGARARLDEALRALALRRADGERALQAQALEARQSVERWVRLALARRSPRLELTVHTLASGQRILHASRLSADEAVLLLHSLSGRLPSRHGFALDDGPPHTGAPEHSFYAEEGVADAAVDGEASLPVLEALTEVWPVKGQVPLLLPALEGVASRLARLRARGAVLEVEVAQGATFRPLLTRAEAEAVTGVLLAAQLAGRLEVSLAAG